MTKSIFMGVNMLIEYIAENSNQIFINNSYETFSNLFKTSNCDKLRLLIPEQYLNLLLASENSSLLSNILTGNGRNNGIISARRELVKTIHDNYDSITEFSGSTVFRICFSQQTIKEDFYLSDLPELDEFLHSASMFYTSNASPRSTLHHLQELDHMDTDLNFIKKFTLFLLHARDYASFFWWLFLFSLCQDEIVALRDCVESTQYSKVTSFLNKIIYSPIALEESVFWELRRLLIRSAKGELFIAGSSLRDAFSIQHPHSIIRELRDRISTHSLSRINVFLTDPEVFAFPASMRDIDNAIQCLQENIYELANINGCELNIFFLALPQIDHAVITDEFMAFRSTKLWNSGRNFKGNFMLYLADYYCSNIELSEYRAHKDYLNAIASHSTSIFPDIDKPVSPPQYKSAMWYHAAWRAFLEEKKYKNIYLYKLYEEQIKYYANSTWTDNDTVDDFLINTSQNQKYSLFDVNTLLGDETQKILLPYLKETEELFNLTIAKHGHPLNKDGYCRIIPSLDMGFPNNVQRLAGGFATGMVIFWKCGVDIVPIDATVNVCTSSVFRLNKASIDPEWFYPDTGLQRFHSYIEDLAKIASEEKGYSFSFTSGNHFLMLAQDVESGDYYLVMHSSANELKKSYMGLYPVENNWYSKKIKTVYNKDHTRYFRYLKDTDARYFIQMAHNFQGYNEQIHQWIAEKFNLGVPLPKKNDDLNRWMYHHYYMPTDSSIAIGAFTEPPGTHVPIFSAFKKPIFIFEIGTENWTVNLGGEKGRVCIVPHGWGQKFEQIKNISIKNANYPSQRKLMLSYGDNELKELDVKSSERIDIPNKHIRCFDNAEDFFKAGNRFLHGRIVKTLNPILEYSNNTKK